MPTRYFLKFKDVPIGTFFETSSELRYNPREEAESLPLVLGYPFGLFEVNKSSKPWQPNKNRVASKESINTWLKERVFSKERPDARELLEDLGIPEYNVWEIVKRTGGVTAHDSFWITPDLKESYEEAKLKIKKLAVSGR